MSFGSAGKFTPCNGNRGPWHPHMGDKLDSRLIGSDTLEGIQKWATRSVVIYVLLFVVTLLYSAGGPQTLGPFLM